MGAAMARGIPLKFLFEKIDSQREMLCRRAWRGVRLRHGVCTAVPPEKCVRRKRLLLRPTLRSTGHPQVFPRAKAQAVREGKGGFKGASVGSIADERVNNPHGAQQQWVRKWNASALSHRLCLIIFPLWPAKDSPIEGGAHIIGARSQPFGGQL